MLGEKWLDCQEMFEHACSFCECASLAESKVGQETVPFISVLLPSVVNSAFACEIFLKTLLLYFDVPYKNEHRLKNLYEMLPVEVNMLIHSQMIYFYGAKWNDRLLDEISNSFVDYRYAYEEDRSVHPFFTCGTKEIAAFRTVLREACCGILFQTTWSLYQRSE